MFKEKQKSEDVCKEMVRKLIEFRRDSKGIGNAIK